MIYYKYRLTKKEEKKKTQEEIIEDEERNKIKSLGKKWFKIFIIISESEYVSIVSLKNFELFIS